MSTSARTIFLNNVEIGNRSKNGVNYSVFASNREKWLFFQKIGDFFVLLLYNPATHRYCNGNLPECQPLEGVMTGLKNSEFMQ
ncbi:hypothetical protein [Aliivibrio kagoshimensis]|uniref:hypothetical protein n=1 Tax=Aliivibrio kagoshimensis TaxID=2910230 RepID=UPI003D0B4AD6